MDGSDTIYTSRNNVGAYASGLEQGSPLLHTVVDNSSHETIIVSPLNSRLSEKSRMILHERAVRIFEAGLIMKERTRTGLLIPILGKEMP